MANLKPIEINKDTLVFFISNWDNEYTDFNTKRILWQNIEKLLKELKSKYNNIFSFFIPWWFKCGTEQYNLLNKYSKVTTILANTLEEVNFYKSNNLNALFCNQNCWLDSSIYTQENCVKEFDLVLNASNAYWKNHSYLKDINKKYKTLFITYKSNLPHNLEIYNPFLKLSSINNYEVNKNLNKSKIGLCLSKKEGSCYASTEYLLCGLPVLSVKSVGGRDIWYNKENSIVINLNVDELNLSIDKMISNYNFYNSTKIRQDCIELQTQFKEKFYNYVEKLLPNSIPIIKNNYSNKMLHEITLDGNEFKKCQEIIRYFS